MNNFNRVQIYQGDVYSALHQIDDNFIDIAITSPPYWNQRDYGFDGQIGNETSPEEYIYKLEKIFDLLLIKLKTDGVFFLNIGDKYISKYGKTPLGFIPFKLADRMTKNGWELLDIIIWYKPNHMPSSVKNRFTNSYEPIFVFGKTDKNIYKSNESNILKINLQPTTFNHIAVFPEKLIESLLLKVQLPSSVNLLDPFAGSGTVLKAAQNLRLNCKTVLIEKNPEYIKIIQQRCQIPSENVIKIREDFTLNNYEVISDQLNLWFETSLDYSIKNINLKKGFLKVFDSKNDFYKILDDFKSKKIKYRYSPEAIFFIGCKEFDLQLILNVEKLNHLGYVIRNLIAVDRGKSWYPLFFIVDDNKKSNYLFNYKKLKIESKTKENKKWYDYDLRGVKVVDNLSKIKRNGIIIELFTRKNENKPSFALIKWEDGTTSKELIIDSQSTLEENLVIEEFNDKINVFEKCNLLESTDKLFVFSNGKFSHSKVYNGKFKELERKNWGASPGARASMEKIYFTVKRLYNVEQKLVSKYLNLKRIQKGISKSELTKLFPKSYKHTVGHWLRDDFGGSIPSLEDWEILKKILDIDENFSNYVCRKGIKLQTVSLSKVKPPDDFLEEGFIKKLNLLYK
ncbi:MAG: site-specific DNA-methyltransferase [Ignavibacterium sp.]|jgi:site-specific DNA-methyltransferase (adenine-specific)|uniref:DNA-methyltransferase n=1 Tax=Ignavibacterium sp. TaxID=2651167 RepID=UPI0032976BBF